MYGTNFSWIRPKGSYVKGIDGRTPGVLKFMELWDKSSEIITAGSDIILGERKPSEKIKARKGAMIGILDIWHPEIKDFIKAKTVPNRLTKFNLSVGIVNGFMEAVIEDNLWNLEYPDTEHPLYKHKWNGDIKEWKENNLPVIVYETIKARELWNLLMESTYTRNDPGVMFLDLANKLNPLEYAEKIFASNPCGTQILLHVKNHVYAGNSLSFLNHNAISNYRREG